MILLSSSQNFVFIHHFPSTAHFICSWTQMELRFSRCVYFQFILRGLRKSAARCQFFPN